MVTGDSSESPVSIHFGGIMAIILEGFDNSGKSTLANSFGLEVLHPGPRPANIMEEIRCIRDQLARAGDPVVMDRVTCISTPAYAGNRIFHRAYRGHAFELVTKPHCVIIYCRPNINTILDFSTHQSKEYDTPASELALRRKARNVIANYDAIMNLLPHLRYDYTNPDPKVVQLAYDAQFSLEAWNTWLRTATE